MDNTNHSSHSRGFAALLPRGKAHSHAPAKPCCDTGGNRLPSGHTMPRIVFIGNPNVGKSSLFNALLGAKARVMNAPGTTVLLEEGVYTHNGEPWDLIDTPGTYSLLPLSPDERVAAEAVMGIDGESAPDLIVAVLDATNISRALYFLSMVLELGRPTVVALTMNDLASKQGTGIDAALLSRALDGVPVVPVNGRTGEGGRELMDTVAASLGGTPLPEGLETIDPRHVDVQRWVEDGADERFDWAARVLAGLGANARDRVTFSDRIDRVLLHPVLGIVIFLLTLPHLFGLRGVWLAVPAADITALIFGLFLLAARMRDFSARALYHHRHHTRGRVSRETSYRAD